MEYRKPMRCIICNKEIIGNKKSFSNHTRWCNNLMDKKSYIGINTGEKNGMWKEIVTYRAMHNWVRRNLTKVNFCQKCKIQGKRLAVANLSQEYKRDLSDWLWMCYSCNERMKYETL